MRALLTTGCTLLGLAGCGGGTSYGAAYADEVALCIAHERSIVRLECGELDPETCEARDTAALALERDRCDAALDAIVADQRAVERERAR
jgi:hypothetical protein